MGKRTTVTEVTGVYRRLARNLDDPNLRLTWMGNKCRIERKEEEGGVSIPFSHKWYGLKEAYEVFASMAQAVEYHGKRLEPQIDN